MRFKHLLITRFAIPFPEGNPRTRFAIDPTWLPKRYALMEKYVVPAVRSQTCKNFEWLIIVNPDFPGIDLNRLNQYGKVLSVPMYWDETMVLRPYLQPYIGDFDWLITSRLDSDDGISRTFIEGIQRNFVEKEAWYTYPRGFIVKDGLAYERYYPSSPFVSYGESAGIASTVYNRSHIYAGELSSEEDGFRLINLGEEFSWMQIDHGGNVKNNVSRLQARGRCSLESVPVSQLTQFDFEGG